MKRFMRPVITIGIGLLLALFSAALNYSAPPAMQGNFGDTAFFLQATPTPQPGDLSRVGSTDGIAAMGVLIALLVIVPILLRRNSWMEPR